MPESGVEVCVEQGRILLVGNEGAASDYAVYTVDGRLVASGRADGGTATIDVTPGLYIVALGSKTAKVAVPSPLSHDLGSQASIIHPHQMPQSAAYGGDVDIQG